MILMERTAAQRVKKIAVITDDALLVVDEVADVVGVVFADVLEETALVAMSKNQSKSGNRHKR